MPNFPLFELKSLYEIKNNEIKDVITSFVNGEILCAALLNSGDILISYVTCDESPTIKFISWCLDPSKKICAMCFDTNLTCLLVITLDMSLYVIPLVNVINKEFGYNWKFECLSQIPTALKHELEQPTALVWWAPSHGNPIGIIGTSRGNIIMIDLFTHKEVHTTSISDQIVSFDIMPDNLTGNDILLIRGAQVCYWILILDDDEDSSALSSKANSLQDTVENDPPKSRFGGLKQFSREKLSEFKHKLVETGKGFMKGNDLHRRELWSKFDKLQPMLMETSFSHNVVDFQEINGQLCFSEYDQRNTISLYKVNLDKSCDIHLAVPVTSNKPIVTDRLIFSFAKESNLLSISSRILAEKTDDIQMLNESILQEIRLSKNEKLVKLFRLPSNVSRKLQKSSKTHENTPDTSVDAFGLPKTETSDLDGCVVVTNYNYYLCLTRVSPDQLFLLLVGDIATSPLADGLASALQMNAKLLYEVAGDLKIACKDLGRALQLYRHAKVSHAVTISKLASQGLLPELDKFLEMFYNSAIVVLPIVQKQKISDLYLNVKIYELLVCKPEKKSKTWKKLKDFILNNTYYCPSQLIEVSFEAQLWNLVIFLIENLGLRYEIFEKLLCCLNKSIAIKEDNFIQCMTCPSLQLALLTSDNFNLHIEWVENNCSALQLSHLIRLASMYDPSQNYVMLRSFYSKQLESGLKIPSKQNAYGDIIYIFFLILCEILKRLDADHFYESLVDKMGKAMAVVEYSSRNRSVSAVSCGFSHSTLLNQGNVYSWGTSHGSALGVGLDYKNGAQVKCIDFFPTFGIFVLSVACGKNHTVALTDCGVFSWGSSKYGQLGLNHRGFEYTPQLITTFENSIIVLIACGSYHTIAYSKEKEIYSWGWGVHGQLGHGNVFDKLIPTKIEILNSCAVKAICAGYAHSLILTESGKVRGFGNNRFGQLGKDGLINALQPICIDLPSEVDLIASSYFHCIAVSNKENKIYSWGNSPQAARQDLQLKSQQRKSDQKKCKELDECDNLDEILKSDSKVHASPLVPSKFERTVIDFSPVCGYIKQVSCGNMHNMILTEQHKVFSWGRNIDFQLGYGKRKDVVLSPICISNLPLLEHVCCGYDFSVALTKDGELFGWGHNDLGQLSAGPEQTTMESPYHLLNLGTSKRVIHLRPTYGSCKESPSPLFTVAELKKDSCSMQPETEVHNNVPRFSTNDKPCYNTESLHLAIEYVGKQCIQKLVNLFQKYHYYQALSKLYLCLDQLDKSFHHLLSALIHKFNDRKYNSNFNLLEVIEKVFNLYLKKTQDAVTRLKLLEQLIAFWLAYEIQVDKLEQLLVTHKEQLLLPISSILFGAPIQAASILNAGQKDALHNILSTSFLIDLMNDLLFLSNEHEKNSLKKALKMLEENRNAKHSDIIHFLYKDLESLFKTNAPEAANSEISIDENDFNDEVVFFSCGHIFGYSEFNDVVVPQFEADLIKLNLYNNHQNLVEDFKRENTYETPCPKCLLKLLRED